MSFGLLLHRCSIGTLNISFREVGAGLTISQGSAGKRPPSQPWALIKHPRWGMDTGIVSKLNGYEKTVLSGIPY